MVWFYIQYAIIGGNQSFSGVRSACVKSLDQLSAEVRLKEAYSRDGQKVLIFMSEIATRAQLNSRSITVIT